MSKESAVLCSGLTFDERERERKKGVCTGVLEGNQTLTMVN